MTVRRVLLLVAGTIVVATGLTVSATDASATAGSATVGSATAGSLTVWSGTWPGKITVWVPPTCTDANQWTCER